MKAMVYTRYGTPDELHYQEVERPTPGDTEVLVKVHATSLNSADWRLLTADPFLVRLMAGGLRRPKHTILGSDVAGRVEAVGSRVTQFKPGDEVYGDLSGCGLGGLAEYICASEDALALKPPTITFEQAAAVPMAAVTALQGLRDKGQLQPGQKVLINGASGGVGTFAVQLARWMGAEVTAVCSTRNVEAARTLGADHVIDYTREDFTRNGQRYDLILGVNGYRALADYRRALTPNGIYVMVGGSNPQLFEALLLGPLMSMTGTQKMGALTAHFNPQDLNQISGLLESGAVVPVIDRCYPLNETSDAFRYLGEGRARGKVVITVEHP